jgi:hypothetical protein
VRRRSITWILAAIAVIAGLAVAALAAVPFVVDTPRVQALIAASATQALGRPVNFQSVSLSLLPLPAIELRGLTVAEDPRFGTAPFLRLDRGRVRLRLGALLTGRVELGEARLDRPLVTVVQDAAGRLNVASLGAPVDGKSSPSRPRPGGGGGAPGAGAVLASRVRIEDGVVTYEARGAGGRASTYHLEGLDLTVTPAPGLVGFQGDAKVMPGDLAVEITDGTVAVGPGKPLAEAPLRGRVRLAGKDLKPLVAAAIGPVPAVGGGLAGVLALAGTVGSPQASGDVELRDLAVTQVNARCPEPRTRTLRVPGVKLDVAWEGRRLTARPATAALGDGTVTTNLAAVLERGLHVDLHDLGVKALPLEAVLVDFLCQGYAVTGPLDLSGSASADVRDPWHTLSGAGRLRIGAGKVVGPQALALLAGVTRLGGAVSALLAADVPASLFASPLEFDSIVGSYTITRGLVTTRDLVYTSRAMRVSVAGDYALGSGRMNLDVIVDHGRGEVAAKVTGTAASPSIRVLPGSVLRSVDPGSVQKGLEDLLKRFR